MEKKDIPSMCPLCANPFRDSSFQVVAYHVAASAATGAVPRSIYICNQCGLGVAYPRLETGDALSYYRDGNYWANTSVAPLALRYFPGHYALASARWEFIKSQLGKEKAELSVLDVGAGAGILGMVIARDKKVKLKAYTAVEPDKRMRESLEARWKRYRLSAPFQTFEKIEEVKGRFDVIIFSHLLEHLYNPHAMLMQAQEFLFSGGSVFLDVPNQDFRFKKDYFPHVLFYTPQSIRLLLEQAELSVKSCACFGRDQASSPLNEKNQHSFSVQCASIVWKMRSLVPVFLSARFYDWHFGATKQNQNGTWIRAIAQKT